MSIRKFLWQTKQKGSNRKITEDTTSANISLDCKTDQKSVSHLDKLDELADIVDEQKNDFKEVSGEDTIKIAPPISPKLMEQKKIILKEYEYYPKKGLIIFFKK